MTRFKLMLSVVISIFSFTYGTPVFAGADVTCRTHSSSSPLGQDLQNFIQGACDKSFDSVCHDVPKSKRASCGGLDNGLNDIGNLVAGCAIGAFQSLGGFADFAWQLGKFIATQAWEASKSGFKFMKDVLGKSPQQNLADFQNYQAQSSQKAAKLSKAVNLSFNQLKNFIMGEWQRNEAKHWPHLDIAAADTAKAVAGPLVSLIAKKVAALVEQQVHDFSCYNLKTRTAAVCSIITDFIFPPATLIAFLKFGKVIIKQKGLAKVAEVLGEAVVDTTVEVAKHRKLLLAKRAPAAVKRVLIDREYGALLKKFGLENDPVVLRWIRREKYKSASEKVNEGIKDKLAEVAAKCAVEPAKRNACILAILQGRDDN